MMVVEPTRSGGITIEVSPGELLDRLTILGLKAARIADPAKLRNVLAERDTLAAVRARGVPERPGLRALVAALEAVNAALWDIEDALRARERDKDFGPPFVALARSVYRHNDRRAALKREINELLGSTILEEKSY